MKKTVVSILFAAIFLLSALSLCIPAIPSDIDGAPSGNWNSGYASNSLPKNGSNYLITCAEDLARLSIEVNNGDTFSGKTILLTKNIDISAHYFTPIGSDSRPFRGTFNGQNYEIAGLNIENGEKNNQGLFGIAESGATIKNLGLTKMKIFGNLHTGGITGRNFGTIQNCYTKDGGIDEKEYTGGIAGSNSGVISSCYNTSNISQMTNSTSGGITSINTNTILNCYNTGDVLGIASGGIVSTNDGTISNCYNTGDVGGRNPHGIASTNNKTISNCYNISQHLPILGGINGPIAPTGFTNCYSLSVTKSEGIRTIESYYQLSGIAAEKKMTGFSTSNWVFTKADFSGSEYKVYFPQLKVFSIDGTTTMKADSLQSVEYIPRVTDFNAVPIPTSLNNIGNSTYEINDEYDYIFFVRKINDGTFTSSNDKFILKNDIHISALSFRPAGNVGHPFNGTFDGNRHVLNGFKNENTNWYNQGIFDYIGPSGKVMNLGVINFTIHCKENIGGIAATNAGTIEGCYTMGSITGENIIGGITGTNNGIIEGCYSQSSISGKNWIGGISGYNNANKTIQKCFNTSQVNGISIVGGIVGSNLGIIQDCYNTGIISGTDEVGGIAGRTNVSVGYCYNIGAVSGTNPIVGNGPVDEDTCYWLDTFENGISMDDMTGGDVFESTMPALKNRGWISTPSIGSGDNKTAYRPQIFIIADNKNPVISNASLESVIYETGKVTPTIPHFEEYIYILGEIISSKDPPLQMPKNATGKYTWINGGERITSLNTTEVEILFTPTGGSVDDYKETVFYISIKVSLPAQNSTYQYTYGESLSALGPAETPITGMGGKYVWSDANDILKSLGRQTVKMIYLPEGYDSIELEIEIDVQKPVIDGEYRYFVGKELFETDVVDEKIIGSISGHIECSENVTLDSIGTNVINVLFVPDDRNCEVIEFQLEVFVDPIPIKDNSKELIIACAIIITGAIISICYILRKW